MTLEQRVERVKNMVADPRIRDLVNELYLRNQELEKLFKRRSIVGIARVRRDEDLSGWIQMELPDSIGKDVTCGTVVFIPEESQRG